MRLTPEQVAEEKKYLSELKERVWIGEHGLTTAEQDWFDTIEALQAENEQLQAQNGAMRDALAKAGAALELSKIHIKSCFSTTHRTIDKALAAIDKIGGREDV